MTAQRTDEESEAPTDPSPRSGYLPLIRFLVKHGRRDLVVDAGLDPMAVEGGDGRDSDTAVSFARDLGQMGPTFIKLGQLLSTRSDLLPEEYTAALAHLQDNAEPVAFAQIQHQIETAFGVPLKSLYATFEETPMASASIGQVHAAVLVEVDTGPIVEELFACYLRMILEVGRFHADPHPGNLLVTDDGKLALIDLGMVASVPPRIRQQVIKLLLAIADADGDEAARILAGLGHPLEGYDAAAFHRDVSYLVSEAVDAGPRLQAGGVLMKMSQLAGQHHLRPRPRCR